MRTENYYSYGAIAMLASVVLGVGALLESGAPAVPILVLGFVLLAVVDGMDRARLFGPYP